MSIQERIESDLRGSLQPVHLEVVNESGMHNVPAGSESHFKVVVASDEFAGLPRVRRHQQVYRILKEYLEGPVHALALHTYSGEEWAARSVAPDSPRCLGGASREGANPDGGE